MDPNCPWGVLPIKDVGDISADGIFRAVGIALGSWENVEDALARLYRQLLGSETEGAQRAYGTVVSFSGRRDMLMVALDEFPLCDHAPFSGFETTINEVGKFSARRNEIAHGTVFHSVMNGVDRGHYLCSPMYNSRKRPSYKSTEGKENWEDLLTFGSYAYTSDQILRYAEHFQRLSGIVNGYVIPARDYWLEQRKAQIDFAVKRALSGEPT